MEITKLSHAMPSLELVGIIQYYCESAQNYYYVTAKVRAIPNLGKAKYFSGPSEAN